MRDVGGGGGGASETCDGAEVVARQITSKHGGDRLNDRTKGDETAGLGARGGGGGGWPHGYLGSGPAHANYSAAQISDHWAVTICANTHEQLQSRTGDGRVRCRGKQETAAHVLLGSAKSC